MSRSCLPVLISLLCACVPKTGRLEANRFQHEEYPYAVFYADGGGAQSPLGSSWRVDNFTPAQTGGRFTAKRGRKYEVVRSYDLNDDGRADVRKTELFYDVLLEHTQKDAALWVRTVPLSAHDADKELSVFVDRYLEAVGGSGTVVVRFGAEAPAEPLQHRYAARTLGSGDCSLSKRSAHRVDFEVADVDEARLSANTRWRRGSVVLVRTGYQHRVKHHSVEMHADYPVLMLVGMSARPQDFELLTPDFERLLQHTVLGDLGQGLSMNGQHTCGAAPASAGGEAVPARPAPAPDSPEALLMPDPSDEPADPPPAAEPPPAPSSAPSAGAPAP